jgi:hypothetical protein
MRFAAFTLSIFFACGGAVATEQPACPPEGSGGDLSTNRLKNRWVEPKDYQEKTVGDILVTLPVTLYTPKSRTAFREKHFEVIEANEYKGIALVGHVVDASRAKPHVANCESKKRRDIELRLVEERPTSPADGKRLRGQSMVAAVTPWGQDNHPAWNLKALEKLAKTGAKLRVSGWMFYNAEPQEELMQLRGTMWEIHPVTKIEVWKDGDWVSL